MSAPLTKREVLVSKIGSILEKYTAKDSSLFEGAKQEILHDLQNGILNKSINADVGLTIWSILDHLSMIVALTPDGEEVAR